MSKEYHRLENWFNTPNMIHPEHTNKSWFARLLAKNGNSLLVQTFGISIPDIGLLESEAKELHYFNGMLFGFFLAKDGQIDPQQVTDMILNPLIEESKKQGFNLGKKRLVYIKNGEA